MAWSDHYVTTTGTDTYANSTNSATPCSLATAIAGYAAGDRINIKAGTYANTTTSLTFGTAGTTTAPVWWRGYNTTPGDIDTNNALTKPAITFTTGRFLVTAAHQIFGNLDISGAQVTAASGQVALTAAGSVRLIRCRVNCTAANANGNAILVGTASTVAIIQDCYLKATTTATMCVNLTRETSMLGCTVEGGADGVLVATNAVSHSLDFCTFFGQTGAGVKFSIAAATIRIAGCSFYGQGGAGVEFTALPFGVSYVVNCVFSSVGTYDINNSTGTNTNLLHRSNNLSHAPGTAHENGFGDSPDFFAQTDSSSPFTNAAGGDLSLVSTSNAKANGLPGGFENQSYTSYLDIGAVQRQEAASGGGGANLLGKGTLVT